jgi:hypothetical protein
MATTTARPADRPGWYEIRLTGHLAARWAARFEGMALTPLSGGVTLLAGQVADQAALHGLLQTLRDIGVPLLSVTRVESPDESAPGSDPD